MPKITVNGAPIDAEPGKKLLEVCLDHGVDVPHYCWHRGLSPAGNCRMCLVKVSTSRKLEVACMINPSENLDVVTEGPEVAAGRKAVLEYMLANHPLDCPICDKAGECQLQDFTYQYRDGVSRFRESKVIRHTKDLGPNVKIWGNRCISCSRCVRFCDEITGTGELALVNRGDHSVVDTHPEIPLDNPMSLNVVDICPVGALIDKNFLYQARVWFSRRADTICGGCSRGCNVTATILKDDIKRLQPRHNEDVNGFWMCDAGRLNTGFVTAPNRLKLTKGSVKDLGEWVTQLSRMQGKGSLAIVLSTWATLEELFLAKQLATATGARVAFTARNEGERWVSKSGFAIETDKTPNRRGAEFLFGAGAGGSLPGLDTLKEGFAKGQIQGMIYVNAMPDATPPAELVDAARSLSLVAVIDLQTSALSELAHVALPAACWFEKDGTVANRDGRVQRINAVVPPPGQARPDVSWLQELLVAIGARSSVLSAEGVFREALPGYDYGAVGSQGVLLPGVTGASAPAPGASA